MRPRGDFYTHTQNFSQISKRYKTKNRLLFFTASAFHSDCDWCFVSLGGVELAVFSGPLDADVEARLNGEYLWGRHFAYSHGKLVFASRFRSAPKRFSDTQVQPRPDLTLFRNAFML